MTCRINLGEAGSGQGLARVTCRVSLGEAGSGQGLARYGRGVHRVRGKGMERVGLWLWSPKA